MWGETTRVENRGETTRGGNDQGGNVLGAKRLVTVWSGSALFAKANLSENLGSLRYI